MKIFELQTIKLVQSTKFYEFCTAFLQSLSMDSALIYFLIGLFAAILILNLYFRVKVFKQYRYLVKNRVEFKTRDIFNQEKMERKVYPQYPEHEKAIRKFVRYIRFSIRVAIVLILLISVIGAVLMFNR